MSPLLNRSFLNRVGKDPRVNPPPPHGNDLLGVQSLGSAPTPLLAGHMDIPSEVDTIQTASNQPLLAGHMEILSVWAHKKQVLYRDSIKAHTSSMTHPFPYSIPSLASTISASETPEETSPTLLFNSPGQIHQR